MTDNGNPYRNTDSRAELFFDLGYYGNERLRHFPLLSTEMRDALSKQAGVTLRQLIEDRGVNAPGLVDAALTSVGLIVPPVTEAPGFDGRDFSNIGGGRV